MPDPKDAKPPEWLTFINDKIINIPPEYKTKTFLFDIAATWVIYVMASKKCARKPSAYIFKFYGNFSEKFFMMGSRVVRDPRFRVPFHVTRRLLK